MKVQMKKSPLRRDEKVDQRKNLWLTRLRHSDQRAQHADSMTSQAASEHFDRNNLQSSRDEDWSVEDQSRTISLEMRLDFIEFSAFWSSFEELINRSTLLPPILSSIGVRSCESDPDHERFG